MAFPLKVFSTIEAVDEIRTAESLQYDFNTIKVATNDFSEANKLGRGGFGAVYKVIMIYSIYYYGNY